MPVDLASTLRFGIDIQAAACNKAARTVNECMVGRVLKVNLSVSRWLRLLPCIYKSSPSADHQDGCSPASMPPSRTSCLNADFSHSYNRSKQIGGWPMGVESVCDPRSNVVRSLHRLSFGDRQNSKDQHFSAQGLAFTSRVKCNIPRGADESSCKRMTRDRISYCLSGCFRASL